MKLFLIKKIITPAAKKFHEFLTYRKFISGSEINLPSDHKSCLSLTHPYFEESKDGSSTYMGSRVKWQISINLGSIISL